MRFNYKFHNICGATYKQGNVVFSPDGNTLYSPIGNRVACFDLVNHSSQTLPTENNRNIVQMAISPNGTILLSIDEAHNAILINLQRKTIIGSTQFREKVRTVQFSPDGRFIAISQGKQIHVWRTPALVAQFRPLVLHRVYTGHFDDVTCLAWSPDSLFFLTGSKDNTCRLYSLHSLPGFIPLTFSGHKSKIIGVYFGQAQTDLLHDNIEATPGGLLYTISLDGSIFIWKWKARNVPDAVQILESQKLQQSVIGSLQRAEEDGDSDADDGGVDTITPQSEEEDEDDDEEEDEDEDEELVNMKQRLARNRVKGVDTDKKMVESQQSKKSKSRKHNLFGFEDPRALWDRLPFIARGIYTIHKKNFLRLPHGSTSAVVCTALYGTNQAQKLFNFFTQAAAADTTANNNNNSGVVSLDVDERLKQRIDAAPQGNLLVVGYGNGVFSLYQLPDFQLIHSLSVSSAQIETVAINNTGDWLAIGCGTLGQMIVWEWQSESYILKQQSHLSSINCLAYSPDGQIVVTGGDDGKVKLWNAATGFCFVTFSDHVGPIQHVEFTTTGTVVLSAGADGTIRAYDLIRYRNFRTLVTPTPVQFTAMTIDPSGEIVVAGGMDPFQIFVWSLQTGKLIDEFSGHTGPISSLVFSNTQSLLVSGSWDGTIRVWDIYTGKGCLETFKHASDVIALAMRHDGRELTSSCIDGNLYIWDMYELQQKHQINARNFMLTGRSSGQVTTAQTSHNKKLLTSICYSPDGTALIAAGESRYAIIFDVARGVLIKRFPLSNNLSLDAMLAKLNSQQVGADGRLKNAIVIDDDEATMKQRRQQNKFLPGSQTLDYSKRTTVQAIRAKAIRFSPTGLQWAACTTEGLLVYCLETSMPFDPLEVDLDITPESCVRAILEEQHYGKALIMALALNQRQLIDFAIVSTPHHEIPMIVKMLPQHRLSRLLEVLAQLLETSCHIQLILIWVHSILSLHGRHVILSQMSHGLNGVKLLTACRAVKRALQTKFNDLSQNVLSNIHLLEYITTFDQHITPMQLKEVSYLHHIQLDLEHENALKQLAITTDNLEQQQQWKNIEYELDQIDRQMQDFESFQEHVEEQAAFHDSDDDDDDDDDDVDDEGDDNNNDNGQKDNYKNKNNSKKRPAPPRGRDDDVDDDNDFSYQQPSHNTQMDNVQYANVKAVSIDKKTKSKFIPKSKRTQNTGPSNYNPVLDDDFNDNNNE